jgi:hypothetical protein
MNDETKDLAKLAEVFFQNLAFDPSCEYGSVGLDSKRPFGNSDVDADILEIIEAKPEGDDGDGPCWSSEQREYASTLYQERLIPYLQERWRSLNG